MDDNDRKRRTPRREQTQSEEFSRFERLTKRLLQVPKKEIDKAKKAGRK
jgi:hypothetical protein